MVGAGDIASCNDLAGARATADLIERIPGTVFAAGDLAYPDGSDGQFAKSCGPTWGRFKDRARRVHKIGKPWGEGLTEKAVWHVVREYASKSWNRQVSTP